MKYQHEETGYIADTEAVLSHPWFPIHPKGGNMQGNIYHNGDEQSVELIKFRISEVEKEEMENKENHLTYQTLLKFFYDTRTIINA